MFIDHHTTDAQLARYLLILHTLQVSHPEHLQRLLRQILLSECHQSLQSVIIGGRQGFSLHF